MSADLSRLRTALTGRYEIERELGSGGMATVYLAHDVLVLATIAGLASMRASSRGDEFPSRMEISTSERPIVGVWSSDGRRVYFVSTRGGRAPFWWMNADGSSQPVKIGQSKHNNAWNIDISPDRTNIVFNAIYDGTFNLETYSLDSPHVEGKSRHRRERLKPMHDSPLTEGGSHINPMKGARKLISDHIPITQQKFKSLQMAARNPHGLPMEAGSTSEAIAK